MFSYRTIAGIGAAALVFMALSRISDKYIRERTGEPSGEFIKKTARKTAGRVEGIIRRRTANVMDIMDDVI
ncbi:MAG: hypothetical protein XD97_0438 [Pelotomaculum thermopropionicum]|uniref:Uncharacterized protein n=1 Tax=Pelotomaculum thermopropionicum TaxID=110500 RepID=A0A101HTC1_9FIRM|nr:MAG: hypothetical protein XD97_0438 [Pelotomaculum thermopropionicum]